MTINETTYSDGNADSGVIYRVRVIDVKPLNDTVLLDISSSNGDDASQPSEEVDGDSDKRGETTVTETQPRTTTTPVNREELTIQPTTRGVETIEEFDNEIPKSQVETLAA